MYHCSFVREVFHSGLYNLPPFNQLRRRIKYYAFWRREVVTA